MIDITIRLESATLDKDNFPRMDSERQVPVGLAKEAKAEIERLRGSVNRLLICGNHIALYKTEHWPDYKPDGLTRDQQCESALRTLGAGKDYDMWCCWSGMMQERDSVDGI
jgi:hypothetical protein